MKRLFFLLIVFAGCHPTSAPQNAEAWKKVKLDFRKFDNDGLAGAPDGKVAAHYEFCIPATKKNWRQVQKIDKTATLQKSRGRVGCTDREWLIIGTTHQPQFQKVLYDLASLPYVKLIQETFYE